jgi:hypothetical protein
MLAGQINHRSLSRQFVRRNMPETRYSDVTPRALDHQRALLRWDFDPTQQARSFVGCWRFGKLGIAEPLGVEVGTASTFPADSVAREDADWQWGLVTNPLHPAEFA